MDKPINVCLLGAGSRGYFAFGNYAHSHPENLKVIAVAEPDKSKMERFLKVHDVDNEMTFTSWDELLDQPRICDYLINATMDDMHYESTLKALDKGYNIMLEKPMAVHPKDCVEIVDKAVELNKTIDICHVLRYSPFFSKIKEIIESGEIGQLITIELKENVGYFHYAHSYIRGNWRNTATSSPMILSKSCHDLDLLVWLAGEKSKKVSSFGSLLYFNEEHMPKNASKRCLDGCPHVDTCPYSVQRIYFGDSWTKMYVTAEDSQEALVEALKEGPYGRCVYQCDNDVVDHQVVNIEFESGVTATFTMCGPTAECDRYINVYGTNGEINGNLNSGNVIYKNYLNGPCEHPDEKIIDVSVSGDPHGGGDFRMMDDFVGRARGTLEKMITSAEMSLESHIIGFAAEKSRLEDKVVIMKDYYDELRRD
ncbi:Gfo/Idh/MocA family protein [Vallitalea guaymasensis]|uniref:Gfo/Idh/MocA family oxidoreductase n=1 Tax=Vallitalea guaymasensis TaxID=1185412 RepID=A0A8J8SCR6_9FIRM|nr:Gfo/Idh/MocA family oxidoreductase [Vallitalea guaymasensis]QUH29711.1 Gfo/Idh/MocA family oxidoreductase [Vallitalea guaymasensis]